MNVHTDSALRSLDAAVATLTVGEQERAGVTLERIIATAPSTGAPQPAAPTPAQASRRRLVLVPTAAVAVALIVGSVAVQGGSRGDPAYTSWTATPSAVSSDEIDAAAAACRSKLHRDDTIDGDRARLVLAERRGEHVALLYRTEDPDLSAACLARNPQGSTDVDDVAWGSAAARGLR